MDNEKILEIKDISKSFSGVQALKGVDLSVRRGSVHALLGENGAGKSTLMKILYGVLERDEGKVFLRGTPFHPRSPHEAIQAGIAMIPQEISPVPNLNVAGNVFLGREPLRGRGVRLISERRMNEETAKLFRDLQIHIDPSAMMDQISIASAQLVAIATAVSYQSEIIIMDEPTSALTEDEIQHLFRIIRDLKEKRMISIIYISHKLDEIFSICDEITVFRDGTLVGNHSLESVSRGELIQMMVGRTMGEFFQKEKSNPRELIFSVRDLTLRGKFEDISFDVHRGEILGIAGLVGSGRTELMEALFGFRPFDSGAICMQGKTVTVRTPRDAIDAGMGFVTEDRKLTGLFEELPLSDNMTMPDLAHYLRGGLLNFRQIRQSCTRESDHLRIKTPSLRQLAKNLSGGNQQKVLLSRWLLMEPEILILDEPTRGIDVGAKMEIHRLIGEMAKGGKAVVLVSSEMPEILSMSDRILVMHEGRCSGELSKEGASRESILRLATGESLTSEEETK